MKNIVKVFITVTFLMVATQAVADRDMSSPSNLSDEPRRGIIETHKSIEASSLRISLSDDLHGFVEGKVCDFCETIRVTITPDTKAYDNRVEVPLIKAKSRIGRYATVTFELETKNVSFIRW